MVISLEDWNTQNIIHGPNEFQAEDGLVGNQRDERTLFLGKLDAQEMVMSENRVEGVCGLLSRGRGDRIACFWSRSKERG